MAALPIVSMLPTRVRQVCGSHQQIDADDTVALPAHDQVDNFERGGQAAAKSFSPSRDRATMASISGIEIESPPPRTSASSVAALVSASISRGFRMIDRRKPHALPA